MLILIILLLLLREEKQDQKAVRNQDGRKQKMGFVLPPWWGGPFFMGPLGPKALTEVLLLCLASFVLLM